MQGKPLEQILQADGRPHDFASLCRLTPSALEEIFLRGVRPALSSLAGWEFKGRNVSLVAPLIRIRRFTKGFFVREATAGEPDIIDGYNVWVEQRGEPADRWTPCLHDGKPRRHGYFRVHPVRPGDPDCAYPHALLIDYALGENPWYHPGRVLKDYVAQVYPDNRLLFAGKAYVALGRARIFGGHFLLERADRSDLGAGATRPPRGCGA